MGIFDSIFGGQDTQQKEKSTQTTTGQTTKEESADTATAKQTAGQTEASTTQEQTQTQKSFTFTPEQMNTLNTLINSAAAKPTIYGGDTNDLASLSKNIATLVGQNLQNAPDVDELVLNARNAAKLDFEENTAPGLTRFGAAAGSEANTLVQQMRLKAGSDLSTKLMGQEGDIRLKAQQVNAESGATTMDAITKALTGQMSVDLGQSQALGDALNALGVAKGGSVTTVGQGVTSGVSSQKSTESELSETLVKALTDIKSKQTTQSQGSTSGSNSGSALNLIDVLLSSLGNSYGQPA